VVLKVYLIEIWLTGGRYLYLLIAKLKEDKGANYMMVIFLISFLIILLDQWFKILVEQSMNYGQTVVVIDNVLNLTYVKNPGAAFGLFRDYTFILTLLSIIFILLFIVFIYYYAFDSLLFRLACGFIIGGAAGNLIDRIRLGYVIDYVDLSFWPVFNLADVMVVIGGVILIGFLWKKGQVI